MRAAIRQRRTSATATRTGASLRMSLEQRRPRQLLGDARRRLRRQRRRRSAARRRRRPGGPGGGRRRPVAAAVRGGRAVRGPMPDLDRLIARLQAFMRGLLPAVGGGGGRVGGFTGGRGLALLGVVVVALWLASGFYRVQPDEQGVVLRFGAYNRTDAARPATGTCPGRSRRVLLPAVTRINRIEIGYRSAPAASRARHAVPARDVPAESLMLTGDENIIDIDFAVFWRSATPATYLFNTRNPATSVKAVAESSMREVIGRTPIQPALTELRARRSRATCRRRRRQILDQLQRRRRDHPGAVAEGRSAGRGDRKLPRRAARQHRRRAHAQRGRGLPQRHRAARPRRRRAHRRRGARAPSRPRSPRPPARRSASCRCSRPTTRPRTSRCGGMYIETMQDILHAYADAGGGRQAEGPGAAACRSTCRRRRRAAAAPPPAPPRRRTPGRRRGATP